MRGVMREKRKKLRHKKKKVGEDRVSVQAYEGLSA